MPERAAAPAQKLPSPAIRAYPRGQYAQSAGRSMGALWRQRSAPPRQVAAHRLRAHRPFQSETQPVAPRATVPPPALLQPVLAQPDQHISLLFVYIAFIL